MGALSLVSFTIQTHITIQLIEANNQKQIHIDPKWGHKETLDTTIHRNILEWLLNCCCSFFVVVVILGLVLDVP